MSENSSKKKTALIIVLVTQVILVIFVLNLPSTLLKDGQRMSDESNSAKLDRLYLDNLLIGTESGEIYFKNNKKELNYIATVKDDIQDIETDQSSFYVASIQDSTEKEESGNSNGKISIYDSKRNKTFIRNFFTDPDRSIRLNDQLLDLEISGSKILTAGHDHRNNPEEADSYIYNGTIDILDKETLYRSNRFKVKAASDIKVYDKLILAYGVGPEAIILNRSTLKIHEKLNISKTIGGADIRGNNIYITSVKDEKLTEVAGKPSISRGQILKYNLNGERLENIDLEVESRPREITAYGEDKVIVNDYADKKIKFADLSKSKVSKAIDLNDRPEEMIVSENQAYAIGKEKNLLYQVDIKKQELSKSINIRGISAISDY